MNWTSIYNIFLVYLLGLDENLLNIVGHNTLKLYEFILRLSNFLTIIKFRI